MSVRLKYILFSVLLLYINCCLPGYFKRGDSCIPCHPGYYSSNYDSDDCKECPIRTFTFSGASSCTTCVEGFRATWDKSHCHPCQAGSYPDENNNNCLDCPKGTFSHSGSSKCEECPAGTFAHYDYWETINCQPCPAGTKSERGSSSCESCPPGTYSGSGASFCRPCPIGTFSYGNSLFCRHCEAGQIPNKDHSGCEPCPAGTFSLIGFEKCVECPPGTYSNVQSEICLPCKAGRKSEKEGSSSCEACPKGTYSLSGSSFCLNCPEGTYSEEGSSYCKTCAEGKIVNKDKSGCDYCPAGTYSSSSAKQCFKCEPGTYSHEGWSSCSTCIDGKRSNDDNTGCEYCPPGTYSPSKSSKCYKCPKGTFSNRGYSSCTPCPEGYYSDTIGSSECKRCPDNTYSYFGSTYCFDCPKEGGYCSGPIENMDDIPERYNQYETVDYSSLLRNFAENIIKKLFGVTAKFEKKYETIFLIPGFTVVATIFDQIKYEVKGDIEFNIIEGKLESLKSGNGLVDNILDFFEKLEKATSGEMDLSYTKLIKKLCNTVTTGEVHMNYDFFKKALEITINYKLKQIISENIFGIKFALTPRGINIGDIFKSIANKVVALREPQLVPSFINMNFDYILEFLKAETKVIIYGEVCLAAIVAAIFLALFFVL